MPAPPVLVGVLATAALAAVAAPASAAKSEPAAPTPAVAWTARLFEPVAARVAPRAGAPVRARLAEVTDFWRLPHTLLVLEPPRAEPRAGRRWLRVRLPGRPNGTSGWVPADAAELATTSVRVRVRVGARRVELLRRGRPVASFAAVVGTGATPTPTGLFAVHDPVPTTPANRSSFGPYILTLTAHSPVLRSFLGGDGLVGIHGTSATGLLGTAASHGCIRVANSAVLRLARAAGPGTPVEILP